MANYRHDQRGNYVKVDRKGGQLEVAGSGGGSSRQLISMRLSGLESLIGKLNALRISVNPILRQAARRSSTPVVKAVKTMLPTKGKAIKGMKHNGKKVFDYGDTGQLRKSIASRVLTSRAGTVHAVIGARRKFLTMALKRYHKPNRNVKAQRNVLVRVRPTLYSHLVEKGFNAKLWRSGKRKFVPGRRFLARSLAANMSQIQSITAEVLQNKIDQVMNSGQPVKDGGR